MITTALGAARDLPVNVLIAAAIACDESADDFAPLLSREWILHADFGEAAREPIAVCAEPERPAAIDRHQLVNAVAIEKSAVERRDTRAFPGQIFAIEIADGQRLTHRGYLNQSRALSTMLVHQP